MDVEDLYSVGLLEMGEELGGLGLVEVVGQPVHLHHCLTSVLLLGGNWPLSLACEDGETFLVHSS